MLILRRGTASLTVIISGDVAKLEIMFCMIILSIMRMFDIKHLLKYSEPHLYEYANIRNDLQVVVSRQ